MAYTYAQNVMSRLLQLYYRDTTFLAEVMQAVSVV